MRKVVIVFLMLLSSLSAFSDSLTTSIDKAEHELFLLVLEEDFKDGRTNFNKDDYLEIYLFSQPDPNSKKEFTFSLVDKTKDHKNDRLDMFNIFYSKASEFDTYGYISSSEKSGDFYKIKYEGKDVWIHKKYFQKIFRVDDCLTSYDTDDVGEKIEPLSLPKGATIFYSKPNGEILDNENIKIARKGFSFEELNALVVDTQFVDQRLWIKVALGKAAIYKKEKLDFEPFEAWVSPWGKNGAPMYMFYSSYCRAGVSVFDD